MTHSIEITPMDDQIPLLPQTKKDEIEDGRKVDHLIEIKEANGLDTSRSQIKKSVNQFFDKKFEDLENLSTKSTIFKVTVGLRESNEDAYTPKIVSIGPYHRKNGQLHPMEKYKLLYLRRFLRREQQLGVESCISELEKVKEEAIKCYDVIEDLDNDNSTGHQNFLEMLLLDGCFVIEFFREIYGQFPKGEDKIINVDSIHNKIIRDLLLLENQLPFFVLSKLHNMTASQLGDDSISEPKIFIWKLQVFLRAKLASMNLAAFGNLNIINEDANNIKHLLHVLHMSCRRNSGMDNKRSDKDYKWFNDEDKILPSATELSEAGVHFEKLGSINYLDIKFNKGKMKIPCIRIIGDMESLLRNLIAYEQQSSDIYLKYFSDFAVVMDSLINTEKDVSLLRKKGIIVSRMEEDKELANFFNRIGKGVTLSPRAFYYKKECRKAFEHCQKPGNILKASLRHNYFYSFWAGTSTVAAIILLILTFIQTVLAFTGNVK